MPGRWRRRRREQDFSEEIRAHLENEIERLVNDGVPPAEASHRAHRAFGNVTRARETFRESRRVAFFDQFLQDLRYAWRGLGHSRTFVAGTVLTLGIGMGLVTALFAVFNAYVLRPFAVHDPYGLFSASWHSSEAGGSRFTWRDYQTLRSRRDLFAGVVAETARLTSLDGRPVSIGFVSGNYFEVLGARIALGRGLVEGDARTAGAEPVAVLTDQAWGRIFARDPAVIGREVVVNGVALQVVGVAAPEFSGLDESPRDLWVPLTMHAPILSGEDPLGPGDSRRLQITTRLERGVTPGQAQTSIAIEPFATRVEGRLDPVRVQLQARATPVRITRSAIALLTPVFAAFALVLVAACANASNVMLARAIARHREIGIRLSIGASRGRVVRQLVTEGLVIALLGAALSLALAAGLRRLGLHAFVALLPPTVAARVRVIPLDFDSRVVLFTLAVSAASTILFALLPALQATRLSLTDALRGQMTAALRGSRFRNLLVTGQVAVSLVLLIVAATLVRNGESISATDLGLTTAGVAAIRQNTNDGSIARAYDALAADPRIGGIAVASRAPLFGDAPRLPLRRPSGLVVTSYSFVSPAYFDLFGMRIVRGRNFTEEEALGQAPVVVMSAAGARALWPGEDPVGKTIPVYIEPEEKRGPAEIVTRTLRKVEEMNAAAVPMTVVGVTADAVNGFVYQGRDAAHIYLPTSRRGSRAAAIMVRGRTTATPIDAVRAVLGRVQPSAIAFDVLAVDEMVALQLFPLRAASWLGSLLSAIALGLSISGLYGVLTYTFGQRTQEIGIRMALGASTGAVRSMVLRQSVRLATLGVAVGLAAGYTIMRLLSSVIHLDNVSVVDGGAFAASFGCIAAAVVVAALAPARRAARIDPCAMLRADT